MPLNKPENYNIRFAPYELKLNIVLDKCSKCPFFVQVSDELERDSEYYGCIYPNDTRDFSPIREPFLTISEIAENTCEFWRNLIPPQDEPPLYVELEGVLP